MSMIMDSRIQNHILTMSGISWEKAILSFVSVNRGMRMSLLLAINVLVSMGVFYFGNTMLTKYGHSTYATSGSSVATFFVFFLVPFVAIHIIGAKCFLKASDVKHKERGWHKNLWNFLSLGSWMIVYTAAFSAGIVAALVFDRLSSPGEIQSWIDICIRFGSAFVIAMLVATILGTMFDALRAKLDI